MAFFTAVLQLLNYKIVLSSMLPHSIDTVKSFPFLGWCSGNLRCFSLPGCTLFIPEVGFLPTVFHMFVLWRDGFSLGFPVSSHLMKTYISLTKINWPYVRMCVHAYDGLASRSCCILSSGSLYLRWSETNAYWGWGGLVFWVNAVFMLEHQVSIQKGRQKSCSWWVIKQTTSTLLY